jgi:uncharacterized protein with ParB-like and HNH nuclease domain
MDYRNIYQTVFNVSDFISWQRNKSLMISPSFQRRSVWPTPMKSYLIDTIVRGFPIPIIFLRDKRDLKLLEPKREVVDGQQRLRTIFSFIQPSLLSDFNPLNDDFTVSKAHNSEICETPFQELKDDIKERILNYKFSVHILPSDTDDREVLQIFARMNSTGIKLNKQELRNAEFVGAFKRLSYTLAYEQLTSWRDWQIFKENEIARMVEVEETSELIQLMIEGLRGSSQDSLDKLYKNFEDVFPYEKEVIKRFHKVMQAIDDFVGEKISTSPFSRRVLFHTLFTFFYDLIYGIDSSIKEKILPRPLTGPILHTFNIATEEIKNKNLTKDLIKVLRGGTGNAMSRKLRLDYLKGLYLGAKV